MLKDWKRIGTHNCLGKTRIEYQYVGTGYFPEVLSRLEVKIGHVIFASCSDHIIHISEEQEAKL